MSNQKFFTYSLPDSDYAPITNAMQYGVFANTDESFSLFMGDFFNQEWWETYLIGDITSALLSITIYPFNMHSDTRIEVDAKSAKVLGKTLFGKYKYLSIEQPSAVLSFGSFTPTRKYNDFRDYAPFTIIKLYLPFVGYITLDNAEVYDKTLRVNYFVDFTTGVATVFVDIFEERTIYTTTTQIGINVSTSNINQSVNNQNFISGISSIVLGIAGTAVGGITGGPGGAVVGAAIGTSLSASLDGGSNVPAVIDNKPIAYGQTYPTSFNSSIPVNATEWTPVQAYSSVANQNMSMNKLIVMGGYNKIINGFASIYKASRPNKSSGTTAAGNAGWYGAKCAYLLYERQTSTNFDDICNQFGRPLQKYVALKDLNGYTSVDNIRFYNMGSQITPSELEAIGSELSRGVIL